MLRMLDLFSGIGGFSYAGEKLVGGYETVAFCEYDKHAQKVLRKHWPKTEIIDDVRDLANDADRFRGMVDIICGGYPCQPFSYAGVRKGDQDDRHLWPAMLAVIKKVRPTWVIGENVAGHITLGLDTVLSDLEAAGYASRCFVIPAVAADARHRRDRCWIVAHTDSNSQPDGPVIIAKGQRMVANTGHKGFHKSGQFANAGRGNDRQSGIYRDELPQQSEKAGSILADPDSQRLSRRTKEQISRIGKVQGEFVRGCQDVRNVWPVEPNVGRVVNGLSGRVHRLRQLGNSIVPQVAARILWAVKEAHYGQ